MNKRILLTVGLIVLGALLFWGGSVYGRSRWIGAPWQPRGMMSNWNSPNAGFGMMGGNMMNGGMMGGMGMACSFHGSGLSTAEPISLADARTAVENYLTSLDNSALAVGEIMIFDNHAYAQIVDQEAGRGAFEVLVDAGTGAVYPEPGPNMMWNTEYGMMGNAGFGMMGMMNGYCGAGMMANLGYAPDAEASVTADKAIELAQAYLDAYLPGKTAGNTADPFPGYYTLHVLENDKIVGMLSVNAYTGQVFLHHWHGDFIEMDGEDHGE
ncbi:MAG: hypothetical protein Fur0021_32480 [Candidatus Promineifilaceae bacterium]